jgi:hypothetical protein
VLRKVACTGYGGALARGVDELRDESTIVRNL